MSDVKAGEGVKAAVTAMIGKSIRTFFNEKQYLNCDCPTCKELQRIHKKTQPYMKLLDTKEVTK